MIEWKTCKERPPLGKVIVVRRFKKGVEILRTALVTTDYSYGAYRKEDSNPPKIATIGGWGWSFQELSNVVESQEKDKNYALGDFVMSLDPLWMTYEDYCQQENAKHSCLDCKYFIGKQKPCNRGRHSNGEVCPETLYPCVSFNYISRDTLSEFRRKILESI